MPRSTRRNFLQSTAAGGSLLLLGTKASGRAVGANNRLRIGVVGANGRGSAHLGGWTSQENVEVAYIVDVDQNVLAKRVKDV